MDDLKNKNTNELLIKLIEKTDEKINEEKENRKREVEFLEKHTDKIIKAEAEKTDKLLQSEKESRIEDRKNSERLFANTNRWIFGLIVILAVALITVLIKT
jgi:uncharacterized membrane protein YcjF (UPF0283 family)